MNDRHIMALRLWEILKQNSKIAASEYEHFQQCKECRDYALQFIDLNPVLFRGVHVLSRILNDSLNKNRPAIRTDPHAIHPSTRLYRKEVGEDFAFAQIPMKDRRED